MTTAVLRPAPAAGILSVECELTGRCQMQCTHCCTSSGPTAGPGAMTLDDWRAVVDDIAELGIPAVQYIGGEPTLSPYLLPLIAHASARRLRIEVYSNLHRITPTLWTALEMQGVSLATSYYSDRADEHEQITGVRGSFERTRANIASALGRGIPVRAGIVHVLDGQRTAEAEADLRALGVTRIRLDRTRAVGRAADPAHIPSTSELCGRCFHRRAAISPDGEVYGCILSRFLPTGNVRTTRLRDVLSGKRWDSARTAVPAPGADACPPDDSGDGNPAKTPACLPKF